MNLPDLTDTEIWTSFKKGDNQAFSFIYSENSEKLYRYGLKFTPDNALVEDAMQDLFAELIENHNLNFSYLFFFKFFLKRKNNSPNIIEANL